MLDCWCYINQACIEMLHIRNRSKMSSNKKILLPEPRVFLVKFDQLNKNNTFDKFRKTHTLVHLEKKHIFQFEPWSISLQPSNDQKAPMERLKNFKCGWACPTTLN